MMNTTNVGLICSAVITLFVLIGGFCLALMYDGVYIWVFFALGGGIVGLPIGRFIGQKENKA